jgi:hypothetical protein
MVDCEYKTNKCIWKYMNLLHIVIVILPHVSVTFCGHLQGDFFCEGYTTKTTKPMYRYKLLIFKHVVKTTWCTVYVQYTYTCFGLASCPSSGGNNVCMQQMVRVVRFSWLSAPAVCWLYQGSTPTLMQPTDIACTRTQYTNCCVCSTTWRWASSAQNMWRQIIHNKLNTKNASHWSYCTDILWCMVNKTLS